MPIKALLPGYPIYPGGSKKLAVYDIKGPASYATGGESIAASQFGEGGIDAVIQQNFGVGTCTQGGVARDEIVPLSMSGTYFVALTYAVTAEGAVTSITAKWYVVATGAEVGALTDLSAEEFRVILIMV